MERDTGIRSLLSHGWLFNLSQSLIGGNKLKTGFITARISDERGTSVIDIGCGTGAVAATVPNCQYLGIDLNANYIARARRRHLPNAEFVVADCVSETMRLEPARFDHAVIFGVMHHLDPERCKQLLRECARILKPQGRLHGVEPTWAEGQTPLEKFVMRHDRGDNILHDTQWTAMLQDAFTSVKADVHHGLLRVPYTMLLFECRP
jgi:SAM-dependent methyltransferase